jgi:hypothetical protein
MFNLSILYQNINKIYIHLFSINGRKLQLSPNHLSFKNFFNLKICHLKIKILITFNNLSFFLNINFLRTINMLKLCLGAIKSYFIKTCLKVFSIKVHFKGNTSKFGVDIVLAMQIYFDCSHYS